MLTYSEPRFTCIVWKTVGERHADREHLVASMFASTCGEFRRNWVNTSLKPVACAAAPSRGRSRQISLSNPTFRDLDFELESAEAADAVIAGGLSA